MTKPTHINLPPTVHRNLLVHNQKCSMTRMNIEKNTQAPTHSHPHFQIIYMLKGTCNFLLGDETYPLEPGDAIYIESNLEHGFSKNSEDLEFLEFFVPGREDF